MKDVAGGGFVGVETKESKWAVQKVHVVASAAKQSVSTVPKISGLLRRRVYPEPVEGLLAKTAFYLFG